MLGKCGSETISSLIIVEIKKDKVYCTWHLTISYLIEH